MDFIIESSKTSNQDVSIERKKIFLSLLEVGFLAAEAIFDKLQILTSWDRHGIEHNIDTYIVSIMVYIVFDSKYQCEQCVKRWHA